LTETLENAEDKDEVYYHIGLAYQSWERHHNAVAAFKQAIEVNPNNENALYELANSLEITGKLEESLPYYESFIDNDPYSKCLV
jgi:tetratricopeptide (TPR) repeat protein